MLEHATLLTIVFMLCITSIIIAWLSTIRK